MSWRDDKPTASDLPNAELADLLRSQKTHLSGYVGKHFFWTESSNASAGIPRLSDGSAGPGSARAFYDTASRVSACSQAGKVMLTSDTSRFYGLHSTASTFLGSRAALVYSGASTSLTTITAGTRWLVQSGFTQRSSVSAGITPFHITFPTSYAVAPFIELTSIGSGTTQMPTSMLTIWDASSFTAVMDVRYTGTAGFYWRSLGTVTL